MLAKLTSKNQITLPKAIVSKLPPTEYFDVRESGGAIILRPARLAASDRVIESSRSPWVVRNNAVIFQFCPAPTSPPAAQRQSAAPPLPGQTASPR